MHDSNRYSASHALQFSSGIIGLRYGARNKRNGQLPRIFTWKWSYPTNHAQRSIRSGLLKQYQGLDRTSNDKVHKLVYGSFYKHYASMRFFLRRCMLSE
jgi:hypothetical protein